MRLIGVFGGTFDPVHCAHLRVVVELRELLGLDEVRVVPAGAPPHRPAPHASTAARVEMLRAALADVDGCVLDLREVERGGASYTVETLESMRAEWPDTALCLMLGDDAFRGLPSWRRWRELFELAHVAVARRPGDIPEVPAVLAAEIAGRHCDDPGRLRDRRAGSVVHCGTSRLEISASRIRELAAERRSLRWLVPDAVAASIARHGWYVTTETE